MLLASMPTMGIDVHSRPTTTSKPEMTTPRRPASVAGLRSLAGATVLQHWSEPVLHSPTSPRRVTGEAAASAATARVRSVLANIVVVVREREVE